MRTKIIEIIGFGIEPERAECKADELIELFKAEMVEMIKCNPQCSPFCKGFDWFDSRLDVLNGDRNELL